MTEIFKYTLYIGVLENTLAHPTRHDRTDNFKAIKDKDVIFPYIIINSKTKYAMRVKTVIFVL